MSHGYEGGAHIRSAMAHQTPPLVVYHKDRQCKGVKLDGTPCKGRALAGTERCKWHQGQKEGKP